MGIGDLFSSLSDNPYFGAGFGLFGIGATAAAGKKAAQVITVLEFYSCICQILCKIIRRFKTFLNRLIPNS